MRILSAADFRPPPLSLYIHLPWCVQKCPYCDFNSHQSDNFDESAYVNALLSDLEQSLALVWGRRIHSVFIGGGTPSLFSGKAIQSLLSQVRALLPLAPNCEVTLETNPNSAEQTHFAAYRKAGVNRISIGAQSFNTKKLSALGRVHTSEEAIEAVSKARSAGFQNLNLDIMFGLPDQSQVEALADLQQAIALAPEHLSWYQLTLEPNTAFAHAPPKTPDHDQLFAIHEAGLQLLADHGFKRYEISAFARQKQRCQHNMNYWRFGDYLGIGAGAHGKLSFVDKIIRTTKHRNPKDYLARTDKNATTETVSAKDLPFEFMLNVLRLTDGFTADDYLDMTGLPITPLQAVLDQAIHDGLLIQQEALLQPTDLGLRFYNDLAARFLT